MTGLRAALASGAAALATLLYAPAAAEPADLPALRAELARLRAEQQRLQVRLDQLEAQLAAAPAQTPGPATAPPVPVVAAQSAAAAPLPDRLRLSGDLRVRYEHNAAGGGRPQRDREALRARLSAQYRLTPTITLGARVVTGDPDDPNSTDVTLSAFDDDLDLSADLLYARFAAAGFEASFGRIPQPFVRTELVWDGDVTLQGASATFRRDLAAGAFVGARSAYFAIDESALGDDSRMLGAQAVAGVRRGAFSLQGALSIYDYELGSLAGADAGDLRTNRLTPTGRYRSAFHLRGATLEAAYQPRGGRWPLRLVADYVRNSGAVGGADSGFNLEGYVGRGEQPGDLRLGYAYAEAEQDAVLAAFSHDNTDLATNYRQHTLNVEYLLAPQVVLGGVYYRYRPLESAIDKAWRQRLRAYFLLAF